MKVLYFEEKRVHETSLDSNSSAERNIYAIVELDNGGSVCLFLTIEPPKQVEPQRKESIKSCSVRMKLTPYFEVVSASFPEYKEANILKFVNQLGASFDAIEIVSQLEDDEAVTEKE